MSKLAELLSLPVQIALSIILGLGLILLAKAFLWWAKNVARHRLPTPFLGEGSNVEWAERKRVELAAGILAYEPVNPHSASSTPVGVDGLESNSSFPADGSGENGRDDTSHMPDSSAEVHKELLQAWLEETGHADDEWAEKLLGDREPSE